MDHTTDKYAQAREGNDWDRPFFSNSTSTGGRARLKPDEIQLSGVPLGRLVRNWSNSAIVCAEAGSRS